MEAEVERLWEISQQSLRLIKERTDFLRREKSSREAALEESGVATRDILYLLEGAKVSRRHLGGVSGRSWRRHCPPQDKRIIGSLPWNRLRLLPGMSGAGS